MKVFVIIISLVWFCVTMTGGIMVITSKKLWRASAMPFRERFDAQATIGSLMLAFGVAAAMLFILPMLLG